MKKSNTKTLQKKSKKLISNKKSKKKSIKKSKSIKKNKSNKMSKSKKYKTYLQNRIKYNIHKYKSGLYKSKKQAIAISYNQTNKYFNLY